MAEVSRLSRFRAIWRSTAKFMDRGEAEFIIRATHSRLAEVYNDRLDRWKEDLFEYLTSTVPLPLKLRVKFTQARKVRVANMALG